MRGMKITGPDVSLNLSYIDLPIGATQIGPGASPLKTGTWRFVRPVLTPEMPPCNDGCPAGVDIRGFIRHLKNGEEEAALASYREENPFPAILGRVCFHPCEASCNRACFDQALSINGLEHYIGDRTSPHPYCQKESGKKVAIVGAGPSGMACAYFLRRLGHAVVIYEKETEPGGILRYGIPAYRLPKGALKAEIERLLALGIEIQTGRELGKNLALADVIHSYDAVYIATGAHKPVAMDIPGADAPGVYYGLDFLRKVATGEIKTFEYETLVIGGGNTAIDAARTIRRLGGRPVIYYRRSRAEMPAIGSEISACEAEGIEINTLTTPVRVLTQKGKVTGAQFIRNELGNPDESGRPTPIPIKGSNYEVGAGAVILALGEHAELSFLGKELGVDGQFIKTNALGQSSNPKVFAGGDVAHSQHTVVHAVKDGKVAAIGIDCYLRGLDARKAAELIKSIANSQGAPSFRKYMDGDFTAAGKEVVRYERLNTFYFLPRKRNERRELAPLARTKSFKEVRRRLSPKAARKEAERCFRCGICDMCGNCYIFCPDGSVIYDDSLDSVQVDYDYCKGCGICMQECPRGAIRMVQEE